MVTCDCHCDTMTKLYHAQESLYENTGHFDVRRFIHNGGGLQFMAIYLPTALQYTGGIKYVLQVLDYFEQQLTLLRKYHCEPIVVLSAKDLQNLGDGKPGMLLAVEDGGALEGSLEILRIFYRLGIRCMTLTWNHRNQLGDGVGECFTAGGLTGFGKNVVAEMNRLGMVVDVSHLSEAGFWDVVSSTNKPIMATHSNAYAVCNVPRNLQDDQIRAIAQLQGVIGINFYAEFLHNDPEAADFDAIYRHVDYILNLVGDDCIAFGSDFDGISSVPLGMDGIESMPALIDYLAAKYSAVTVEKISYKNAVRVLTEVLQ